MSRDDRSWNDGDKLSFSERDRRRREGRSSEDRRPRGVSQAKVEEASKQYIQKLDELFSKKKSGVDVEKFAAAMRAAHGTSGLATACREYRDAAGLPDDPLLLGMFLEHADAEALHRIARRLGGLWRWIAVVLPSGPLERGFELVALFSDISVGDAP